MDILCYGETEKIERVDVSHCMYSLTFSRLYGLLPTTTVCMSFNGCVSVAVFLSLVCQDLTGLIRKYWIAVFDEFVYRGALTHSSVHSSNNIQRHSGFTRSAMQNSDYCIWRSRLALSTKLLLYNACILPIMLYRSECWAPSKADARKIDALDQWCLRWILDIRWCQHVSNREVWRITEQTPFTLIIQKRCLMLFGHLARMDGSADARRILSAVFQGDLKRPAGRPHTSWLATMKNDLSYHNLSVEDATKLTLDWQLWRLLAEVEIHTDKPVGDWFAC